MKKRFILCFSIIILNACSNNENLKTEAEIDRMVNKIFRANHTGWECDPIGASFEKFKIKQELLKKYQIKQTNEKKTFSEIISDWGCPR